MPSFVFADKPIAPVVQTLPATDITFNSANLACSVTAGSSSTYAEFKGRPYGDITWMLLNQALFSASLVPATYVYTWAGLSPNSQWEYFCSASNSEGASNGAILSFTTLDVTTKVASVVVSNITDTSAVATGSVRAGPSGADIKVFLNGIQASSLTIPASTEFITVPVPLTGLTPATNYNCVFLAVSSDGLQSSSAGAVFQTSGPHGLPPISNTISAVLYSSYNGFELTCDNFYGGLLTRLFMRLIAGEVTKDYYYATVPEMPYLEGEYTRAIISTYNMYPYPDKPALVTPLILPMNTQYIYQCCSKNELGESCGNAGSIFTPPYTLTFDYTYNPPWATSVDYSLRSIWAMTIDKISDPSNCANCGAYKVYYLASDETIQSADLYDLWYDPNQDGIPGYNCCSVTHDQSCSDAYRWDCNPKDGILDIVDVLSGKEICAVLYIDGYEHFHTCPAGLVQGYPLYSVAFVGGLPGLNSPAQCCPLVPFPFGNAVFAVGGDGKGLGLKDSGISIKHKGGQSRGLGGYEKIIN